MKRLKYALLGILLSASTMAFDVPNQDIIISGEVTQINMERLLDMTQMIESRGGRDPHKGRIAKTSYQYEMQTAKHYIKLVPDLKKYVESSLNRKLELNKESDARYITYIIYMSKIQYHRGWLDKYDKYYSQSGDVEWAVYKVLWNSVKGASTYKKWKQRERELFCIQINNN